MIKTYTTSGNYTFKTTNAAGCDSTATLNLTINSSTNTTPQNVTACNSFTWNGTTYTQSGTYTFNSNNNSGCTNTATLNLTINKSSTSTTPVIACDSYTWNGQAYTQSGNYTFKTTNAAGCDSTATLVLTIKKSTTSSTPVTACDSYTWNGQTYTQSGNYTFKTTNAVGCDSTATLNLTINSSTNTTPQNVIACNSFTWNGTTYTQSGTYTFNSNNNSGCTNTATLNLTINKSSTSTTPVTACDSYQWNGQTYTQSGNYTFKTTNAAGCDSTATLNLTINRSTSNAPLNETACDNYTWNGKNYTQSGLYTYTTTNSVGCTSTFTLDLTINNSTSSSEVATTCDSYIWNGTTYTQSGTYKRSMTNKAGCDSIMTLNLTINNCEDPCITDNFRTTSRRWRLFRGARIGAYNNPARGCVSDTGIITPGVGGNNPARIRTPLYISKGSNQLEISFDLFRLNANLSCNSWSNFGCGTLIDVYYVVGNTRYTGVINYLLPPNGPQNSPRVKVVLSVGNTLPAGTRYSIEFAFKSDRRSRLCIQQNTKLVIDNFSVCELNCTNCTNNIITNRRPQVTEKTNNVIKVWPNPASNLLNIGSDNIPLRVEMYDVLGNLVMVSRQSRLLNINHVKSGNYYIKVFTGDKVETKSIIVIK